MLELVLFIVAVMLLAVAAWLGNTRVGFAGLAVWAFTVGVLYRL